MISLKIKQKRIGPVTGHHPWVFSYAFVSIPGGLSPGGPVKPVSEKSDFLAIGYFSSYSQITVRIWGYNKDENVDEKFFIRRIEKAYRLITISCPALLLINMLIILLSSFIQKVFS
jgi:23S rRNA (cytosine1962-C5)-methyltransferase